MLKLLISVNLRNEQRLDDIFSQFGSNSDNKAVITLRKAPLHAGLISSEPHHAFHQAEDVSIILSGFVNFPNKDINDIAQSQGHARAIAYCYSQKSSHFLADVNGEYVIAIYDHAKNRLLIATDRSGTHPVYYHCDKDGLVCANRTDLLRTISSQISIDQQSIYNYLYFHAVPGPASVFKDVQRLLPGQVLEYQAGGKPVISHYWKPHYEDNQPEDFPRLKEEFLELLKSSVRKRMLSDAVGCFLSGGTDSSTIAGFANQLSNHPIKTFSIGFDVPGYDEMEYARTAASHFKTDHHEYYVTPADITAGIAKIAYQFDEPFGNSSAIPSYYCAKLAKENGIDILLGGDGGDELFAGNTRYYKQHLFARYSDQPALVRFVADNAIQLIPFAGRIPLIKKVKSYIDQANIPMPDRMESYNLLSRLGQHNVLHPEFATAVNFETPLNLLRETYNTANTQSMLNRMLALDLRFTLADNDLPKVTNSSHIAGIDVLFPLLDDDIVAFANRLPVNLKLRGNYLRYFFKQALSEHLPAKIINKSKHGFGLPFGEWFKSHKPLYELTCDSLNTLKDRAIVKSEFIDQLINTIISEHPGYYGNMVWILLMLEQWFEHHYDKH